MELKVYLNILIKKWWIVVPTFLITLTAGIFLTYSSTPIYRATATYIVVPGASLSGDARIFSNSLEALSRRDEIATTFTEIASSRTIKLQGTDSLDIESPWRYSVSSNLRTGTNIVEFTASGPNPNLVTELANRIGMLTEEYIAGLYEVFQILPLDEATVPRNPISPNYSFNIILAAILGLILGGGLAFLSEYLDTPIDWVDNINIIDSQTGVYNKDYFLRRLSTEMARSKRNRYPLSVAFMKIDNLSRLKGTNIQKLQTDFLRQIALLLDQHLREEDVLAHLENNMFAILLPDMTGRDAKAMMEYLQTRVSWTRFQATTADINLNLRGIFGVAAYNYNGINRNVLIDQVSQALHLAEGSSDNQVCLFDDPTSSDTTNHA